LQGDTGKKLLPEGSAYKSSLLGESVPIVELRQIIKQVAPTDVTVLITGESGSGKEVVANEIFKQSNRSSKPLLQLTAALYPKE